MNVISSTQSLKTAFLTIAKRLQRLIRPLSHVGVPDNPTHAEKRELVTANVVIIFSIIVTTPDVVNYFTFDNVVTERAAICALAATLLYVAGFLLVAAGRRFAGILIFVVAVFANLAALTIILGTNCGVQYYFIAVGVGTMFVWPRRYKRMRVPFAVTGFVLFYAVMHFAKPGPFDGLYLPQDIVDSIFRRQSAGAYLISFALAFYSLFSTETAESALEKEHHQSESLLLNILPKPIAQRLKQNEVAIADGFDDVTILFADVVGFTPLSERLEPHAVVSFLNGLFREFDLMAQRLGLEKVKTIGDAYMVAGGIPERRSDHAQAVAEMALAMREFARTVKTPTKNVLLLRIGIHTGPAVAGVIGLHKFAYDIWGDTVNTAARMESHGVPGEIQVTERTRRLLDGRFEFEDRGLVEIKGKGPVAVFLLRGPKHRQGID